MYVLAQGLNPKSAIGYDKLISVTQIVSRLGIPLSMQDSYAVVFRVKCWH